MRHNPTPWAVLVVALVVAPLACGYTLDSPHAGQSLARRRPPNTGNCTFTRARPKYAVTCPAGLTPNPGATVVTSYLHTPSKRSTDVYLQRMKTFFQLEASVVAFVDYAYVQVAETLAPNPRDTLIVPVTFAQFRTLACGLRLWQGQHAVDVEKERHTPTLYPVWAEKATMVATAARANCFKSQFFVWLDVGYFSETPVPVQPFPAPQGLRAIRPGQVLFLAVEKETIARVKTTHMRHNKIVAGVGHTENIVTVGGGGFAGDFEAVTTWERAYLRMLDAYRARGWFMGKDQNVFVSVCLETPSLCTLHDSNKQWYDMVPLLMGTMALKRWEA